MKKHFALLFICFASLNIIGCKQTSSTAPLSGIQEIFPLKVADTWTYRQQRFDQAGVKQFDTTGTISISGEETFQGYHAYHYSISGTPGFALVYYVGNDVYSVDPGDTSSKPHIVLRYPMNVGETLVLASDTTPNNGPVYKGVVTFIGNNEPITTPAGSFSCVHYRSMTSWEWPSNIIDTNQVSDDYYASGVGQILSKTYQYSSSIHYLEGTFELQSYVVK